MTKSPQPAGALTITECTALPPHCSPSQKHTFGPVSKNQSESLLAAEEIAEKKMEFSAGHYTSQVEKVSFL